MSSEFDNVMTIVAMTIPSSVKAMQRFFGMMDYLNKFIINFADETQPLRYLLEDV